MVLYDGVRIDPVDSEGVHLVENEGGRYIYIKIDLIPELIKSLNQVVNDENNGGK